MVGSDDPFLFSGGRYSQGSSRWTFGCQSCISFTSSKIRSTVELYVFFQKAMVNLHWPLLGYDFTILHICLLNSILTYLFAELVWTFSCMDLETPMKRLRGNRWREWGGSVVDEIHLPEIKRENHSWSEKRRKSLWVFTTCGVSSLNVWCKHHCNNNFESLLPAVWVPSTCGASTMAITMEGRKVIFLQQLWSGTNLCSYLLKWWYQLIWHVHLLPKTCLSFFQYMTSWSRNIKTTYHTFIFIFLDHHCKCVQVHLEYIHPT